MSIKVKIGNLHIGDGEPIAVQTMCNTHTADIEATIRQCERMHEAGADIIRITVPGLLDVPHITEIRQRLRAEGICTPLVADIHFSSATAIAVAPHVEKVRINPGNFNKSHEKAAEEFRQLMAVCREYGTAIRIGINHGSLGEYITNLYGNTSEGMAMAAMEWLKMCAEEDFDNVVVSLKSSNTKVMVEAYRLLQKKMQEYGKAYPLHVGVTEAGNGISGRMKSCVGIWTLLSEGIGDTLRVSLTEDPVNEIPVGRYLAERKDRKLISSLVESQISGKSVKAVYDSPSEEKFVLDFSCDFGPALLDGKIDEIDLDLTIDGQKVDAEPYVDALLQASRRRFTRPEYVACPGCGRTMYNLQETFEEVKKRTSHLGGGKIIAVMGCIVNGPGEMADADWGYVGEGNHLVSIYKGKTPLLRHIPDSEAVDRLVELIEGEQL